MAKRPIKIVHGKLGQFKADGMAFNEKRVILLDERLSGKNYLETAIHEVLHIQNPKWNEITVEGRAKEIANILWELGFRSVDLG